MSPSELHPIEHARPLPSLEKIKRDADNRRREPRPRREDERSRGSRPEEPPHIDEYA